MDPFSLVSRLLGSAVLGSSRPVAVLFAVQVLAALTIHQQGATLPAEVAWTVSPFALMVGLIAAVIELIVQHTEGADELVRALHVEKVLSGVAGVPALALLLLLTSVGTEARDQAVDVLMEQGVSEVEAQAAVDEAAMRLVEETEEAFGAQPLTVGVETEEVARAMLLLEESQLTPREKGGFFLVAFLLQLLLTALRGQLRTFIEELELEGVWAWMETGGIGVGLVVLLFSPMLILVFASGLGVVALGAWAFLRSSTYAMDQLNRRACPACDTQIRVEALKCFSCGETVVPVTALTSADPRPVTPAPVLPGS